MDEDTAREIAELKARCDRLEAAPPRTVEPHSKLDPEVAAMLKEALSQSIALQAMSAFLLAEVALLDKDPASRLSTMGARLLGYLEGMGLHLQPGGETEIGRHATKLIEGALATAESELRARRTGP